MNQINNNPLKTFLYDAEMIFSDDQLMYHHEMLDNFFQHLEKDAITIENKNSLIKYLDGKIAETQDDLNFYINNILKNEKFKQLESSWLSIYDLVKSTPIINSLKILLLPVNAQEIMDDIGDATDFDQSNLFKRVYEDNYGTPGGEPIAAIVFDHYFTKQAQDVKLMADLTNILAAAHIQVLSSVSPSVFDIKSFHQMNNLVDLKTIFEGFEFINWNGFREKEESRYLNLFLPRVLKRLPYDPVTNPIRSFNFKETIDNEDHGDFCWGNAAYNMAQSIVRSFLNYQWLAAIRGVENGGKIDGMPIYTYKNFAGEDMMLCPTETPITDRKEKELSDLGFLSLCYFKQSDYSVFFGSQTFQKPLKYDDPKATANALLSTSLPFMLNASRFAHYMKCMIRDCIGSNMSREDVEDYLQKWISGYVILNETNDDDLKIKYPLKGASVQVMEKEGQPGNYYAVVRLIPHLQLETINISTRLVVSLPVKNS
jgi:type VI secretion system protein ImpC